MNSDLDITLIDVTSSNVSEHGIYCVKDKKAPGYQAKIKWFQSKMNEGLKIKIAVDKVGKQVGFIEYIPSELAWRPIHANNFLFIQCIALFVKDVREQGLGSLLLNACETEALAAKKAGLCAMSSDGVWIANKKNIRKKWFCNSG